MAKLPPWPRFFTSPADLLRWLHAQSQHHRGEPEVQRHLLTLRWLLLAEAERTAPARGADCARPPAQSGPLPPGA